MFIRLLFASIILSSVAAAQHLFPLETGDTWQYHSSDPQDNYLLRMTVEGDTIASNGKAYKYLTGSLLYAPFLRVSGDKVYGFHPYDSTEFILFDFDANIGDTMSVLNNGMNSIVLANTTTDVQHRSWWVFILFQGPPGNQYDLEDWSIQDSIGLTYEIGEPGMSYHLTGAIINGDTIGTVTSVSSIALDVPKEPELYQNYPNPFNPSTTIEYYLPRQFEVSLEIYDVLGRLVATLDHGVRAMGRHTARLDAASWASGVYFCRLRHESGSLTRKLVLVK